MKDFVEFLKLPPSVLAAVSLGSGLVLFLPKPFLIKLGLNDVPQFWNTVIGITFIISLSILLIYLLSKTIVKIISALKYARYKLQFPKMMKSLRVEERKIVCLLYCSPNYTSYLPSLDGVTIRLRSKGVIQHTSSSSITIGDKMSTPFTITPIAQRFIDNHQEYITEFKHMDMQNVYTRLNDPLYM